MHILSIIKFVHLVAISIWVGGLITLAVLVPALRKHGADTNLLRFVAKRYSLLAWPALGVAILTGIAQVELMALPWSYARLLIKLACVGLVLLFTLVHQLSARKTGPMAHGIFQLLILLATLGAVAAAVSL